MSNINLADEAQVEKAGLQERELRKQELTDIQTVLSNASGRRFVWRVLEKCNSFASVFNPDSLHTMSYLSGQQDLGHFLMKEITIADENLLIKLMKLNRAKEENND